MKRNQDKKPLEIRSPDVDAGLDTSRIRGDIAIPIHDMHTDVTKLLPAC